MIFQGDEIKGWRSWEEKDWTRYQKSEKGLLIKAVNTTIGMGHPLTIITGDHSYEITLAIAGADGVDTGTVYLREMVDGDYVERGHYSNVPFKQS